MRVRIGDDLVGMIETFVRNGAHFSGMFKRGPDFDKYRPLFEQAVAADLALNKGKIAPCEGWYAWKYPCDAIDRLEPTIGEPPVPIENFAIDAEWHVEFDIALWWQVEIDKIAMQAAQDSQFRNIETRFS